jgi:hypothetical protein
MTMSDSDYAAYYQNQQIQQAANDRATQAYNASKLRGEEETRAQAAAQFAWKKTLEESGLTGMYQGQWTQPVRQWQAETFGTWGAPTEGQQTQAAQQQQFGQGQNLAAMYGQYYAPGQAPQAGMQTQTAQEQQYTQWLRAQQQALAEQSAQQQAANQYLTLLSNLRGPADWAKYQEVLGAGGNMNSLAAAAMGQYIPGGGATSGVQPQAANLNTLYGQVAGAAPQYQQYQPQPYQPNVAAFTPQGSQPSQPGANYQYSPTDTGSRINQSGWAGASGQPTQAQNALGNGTNTMGAQPTQAQQLNLPAPNQVAMQSWNNLAPSQQQNLLGSWESQGWNKDDVTALMNQSLPKYGANAASAGTWRLR